eukprot:1158034-Pelagomonas_calceolata.AAC.3
MSSPPCFTLSLPCPHHACRIGSLPAAMRCRRADLGAWQNQEPDEHLTPIPLCCPGVSAVSRPHTRSHTIGDADLQDPDKKGDKNKLFTLTCQKGDENRLFT